MSILNSYCFVVLGTHYNIILSITSILSHINNGHQRTQKRTQNIMTLMSIMTLVLLKILQIQAGGVVWLPSHAGNGNSNPSGITKINSGG
jgi:hypothetical protein